MICNPSSEIRGVVFNIMRFSLHDGPGIRTAVFLKGCPLACWWCHNPESQNYAPDVMYSAERCQMCGECMAACPHGAIVPDGDHMTLTGACERCGTCVDFCGAEARSLAGRTMTAPEILAEIERDQVFFDESGGGVTFTGGEPFRQPELLEALLTACKARRIHTAIETCGAAPRDTVLRLSGIADLILYDFKLVDSTLHRRFTGIANRNILENLKALVAARRRVIVRIPVVPGVNDSITEIRAACQFLADLRPESVELLAYHAAGTDKYKRLGREYRLPGVQTPQPAALAAIAAQMQAVGISVKVG